VQVAEIAARLDTTSMIDEPNGIDNVGGKAIAIGDFAMGKFMPQRRPAPAMPPTTAISFTRSGRCSKMKKDKKTKKSDDEKPSNGQPCSNVIGDWRPKGEGENCWNSSEKSLPR
jgi:hypothetical protein